MALLSASALLLVWGKDPPAKVQRALDEKASYKDWAKACLALPSNRGAEGVPTQAQLPLKTAEPLYRLVDRLVASEDSMKPWVANPEETAGRSDFRPFAQRLTFPAGSRVVVHGDLHGDIRSLMTSLNELQHRKILTGFKVTAPKTHLVFLGDYTDRGRYGSEVLYTLLRLRLENPMRVWLSRGNHEDPMMVNDYGYVEDAMAKFGPDFDAPRVTRLFEGLPSVIYLGSGNDYVQSCHGGMEPGYDPIILLNSGGHLAYQRLGKLKRETFRKQHPDLFDETSKTKDARDLRQEMADFVPGNPTEPRHLGFLWHDFSLYQNDPPLVLAEETMRLTFGQSLTHRILKAHSSGRAKVRGVIRAHQHTRSLSPIMKRLIASKGVFRHWQEREGREDGAFAAKLESSLKRPLMDGGVYTFNVSPDSAYGEECAYNFHTIGILTTAARFEQWRMEVVNLKVPLDTP